MLVVHRTQPAALPEAVIQEVRSDLDHALNSVTTLDDQFIVNPSAWYSIGSSRLRRAVMNSASFISTTFQDSLEERGWECEYKRRSQKIDAFKSVEAEYESVFLEESRVRALLDLYFEGSSSLASIVSVPRIDDRVRLPTIVRSLYGMYVERRIHLAPDGDADLGHFFEPLPCAERSVRFGLEFETGNIASAFRSIMKLNILYELDEIDIGVFITTDRESATNIWPSSNRNGSFEELENRRYSRNVLFPIWEVLFKPDGYDADGPYLSSDGGVYDPQPTGETLAVGEATVPVFRSDSGARVYQLPAV